MAVVSCCVLIMSCGKSGFKCGGTHGREKDVRELQRAWESRAVHIVGQRRRKEEAGKDNIVEIKLFPLY